MNMKSLALISLASLLAASVLHAAPASVDEPANNLAGIDQMASASTDGAMDQGDSSSPSMGSDATAPSSGTGDNSGSTNSNSNSNDNSSMGSSDQGSPDTATGDDDY